MDEDTSIINTKTRNEKIKDFFLENKKSLISTIIVLILILIGFYSYQLFKDGKKKEISNRYNSIVIEYQIGNELKVAQTLKEIVNAKDITYSPLALYFIIDNKLVKDKNEINDLFDVLIDKTSLETEIKNLVIYKKALFNADLVNELELLNILNPLINSNSIWKSHALYLMGEFFFNNGENQKSKDFFQKIISIENSNPEIMINAQRRLNRDLSD
tara:strand:+ start:594 stop:1238 length:645 start_codon:yes stop_codon:yes gene_type:complete